MAEAAVRALDAATGREIWRFGLAEGSDASMGQIAVHDDAVYVGTRDHRVYALDLADGQVRWVTDIGPEWQHLSIVRGVTATADTLYVAVDQWRAENGHVSSGWIVAMERSTGRVLWRTQSGTGQQRLNVSGAPTLWGRLLLASDELGNSFFAVDRFTGKEVWRHWGARDRFGPAQSPTVVEGVGYVGSHDLAIYAFDPQTGRIHWRTPVRASIRSFAVCKDLIFANHDGLVVLDRRSGRKVAERYGDSVEFLTSAFAVAADQSRVYEIGNRYVYAFACQ